MLNIEGIVLEPAGAMPIDVAEGLAPTTIRRQACGLRHVGRQFRLRAAARSEGAQPSAQGVKKYFVLRMPQRPGALRDFLRAAGPEDDIARFEYLKKSARNFGSVLIGIEVPDAAEFSAVGSHRWTRAASSFRHHRRRTDRNSCSRQQPARSSGCAAIRRRVGGIEGIAQRVNIRNPPLRAACSAPAHLGDPLKPMFTALPLRKCKSVARTASGSARS